jgi:hypothetical protein
MAFLFPKEMINPRSWWTDVGAMQDRIGELAAENIRLREQSRSAEQLLKAMSDMWQEMGQDLDASQRELAEATQRAHRLHDQVAALQQALGAAQQLIASMTDQRPRADTVQFTNYGRYEYWNGVVPKVHYELQKHEANQHGTAAALGIPAFLSPQDERTEFDIWAWLAARKASNSGWWRPWLHSWLSGLTRI